VGRGLVAPRSLPALDTTTLVATEVIPPGLTANQELHFRTVQKMRQLEAAGVTTTYATALQIVAVKYPALVQQTRGEVRGRFV